MYQPWEKRDGAAVPKFASSLELNEANSYTIDHDRRWRLERSLSPCSRSCWWADSSSNCSNRCCYRSSTQSSTKQSNDRGSSRDCYPNHLASTSHALLHSSNRRSNRSLSNLHLLWSASCNSNRRCSNQSLSSRDHIILPVS